MRVVTGAALVVALNLSVVANDFRPDDKIVILVSGPPAVSTPWGLSGEATMYRATSTHKSGNMAFAVVEGAEDVACERRSAKKVTQAFDYSTSGQIPPGVYFLSYHRLDPRGNRHRLAIGDTPSGTTIQVKVGDTNVTRTDIQFHEAANNLSRYTPRLSEGCIIFNDVNFRKLFQNGFLDPNTSPLAPSQPMLPSSKDFNGKGHVLVFVTDLTDSERNQKQRELFETICTGRDVGLNDESFEVGSKSLRAIRLQWSER